MNDRQKSILMRRKPTAIGDGENSDAVTKLANKLIRKGHTRQAAYAKARKKYREEYRRDNKKMLQGGSPTPR